VTKKLRLAASAALLGFLAWRTDWGQVRAAFATLRLDLWFLAAAVYAATQAVSSVRWQLFAGSLGFREPYRRYLSYYYIGMFFNLVLPTSVGGDVVRAWYLDARSGRRANAFVTVIADRVSGVLVLLLLALMALPFRPPDLPAWLTWTVAGLAGGALLSLTLLCLTSWLTGTRYSVLSARYSVPGPPTTWHSRLFNLQSAICNLQSAIFPSRRVFLLSTALSIIVQLANVLVVWLIGQALGLSVPGSYYLILVPTVTLLTLLPISLNGMGVREGSTVVMLAPLGVDSGTAITLALLWFAAFVLPSMGGVLPYLWGNVPRFKEKTNDQSLGGYPDQGRAGQSRPAA
jgi:glycosyltransferase 2 family protein